MTRVPRNPETGKPLPRALVEEGIPEWIDEETKPIIEIPSDEELDAHLEQVSGDAGFWRRR